MKILMVCLGNVCRSPLAEGILRHKAGHHVIVDSAGTADFNIGKPPDTRMIATASQHGIDISELRARQFKQSDYNEFDLIYAMDTSNYHHILSLARDEADRAKVKMILEDNFSVPDPYNQDGEAFERVYQLLDAACKRILSEIPGS